MPDDIKLPEPYCYVHEYDSCLGRHRSFYPGPWNGMQPSRTVPVYTDDQVRAAVEAELARLVTEDTRTAVPQAPAASYCDECGCTHAPGENTVCPTWMRNRAAHGIPAPKGGE